ncbi:hypothetical protein [Calothrix sp. NIES-2098]|uniref:hypothetical protein n=1 Tax=Calothrix sp. NIES-2098 TaxID=1954171 RepID=UPI000B5EEDCF|nr:hypothetical protein NIES2098_68690 [Calothrix sp. NIES-2098]
MTLWKQLRIIVLAMTLGGVIFVLVKVFLTPSINKPKPEQSQRVSDTVASFKDRIYIVSSFHADYNAVPPR